MQLVYDPGEEAPAFTASEKGKGRGGPTLENAECFGGGASSSQEGECNEKTEKWIQEQSDFEMAKRLQREFDQEDTDPLSRSGITTQPLVTQSTNQRPLHVIASSQASGSSISTSRDLQRAGLALLRILDLQESCGPWCYGECDKSYLHLYGTDVTNHEVWNLWDTGAGNSLLQTEKTQEPRDADATLRNESTTIDSLGDGKGCENEASDWEMAKRLQKEFDEEAGDTASDESLGVYEDVETRLEDSLLPSDNQSTGSQGHEANNSEPPRLRHVPVYSSPLRLGYYSADEGAYISTTVSEQESNSLKRNAKRHRWGLKKSSPIRRQLLIGLGFVAHYLYKKSDNGCTCEYERDELLEKSEIFSIIPRVTLKGLPKVKARCDFCIDKDFEIGRQHLQQLGYRDEPDIPDDDTVVGDCGDEEDDEEDDEEEEDDGKATLKRFLNKILFKPCTSVSISNILCVLQ